MAKQLAEVMKQEHRTRSELIREALRRYMVGVATGRKFSTEIEPPQADGRMV